MTPNLPMRLDYFPLAALSEGVGKTSASDTFQPFPTPTPISSADSYDFAPLRSVTSTGGSSMSNYGSPGAKRKRNITKLGNKIDAWWSAVRTSFSGAVDEREARPRRTSTDQPRLARMPTLEAMPSRTSSHYLRPITPSTPSLRNAASASDLPSSNAPPSAGRTAYQSGYVPTGPLAPSARVDTHRRKPSPSGASSLGLDDSEVGAAGRARRNPHLSLNLGPEINSLAPRQRSPSPAPKAKDADSAASTNPPLADVGPQGQTSLPIRVPTSVMSPPEDPRLTPGHSPMWVATPALVPSEPTSSIHPRKSQTLPAPNRPKISREGQKSSFSMHTVRQQIRQRLASAKDNCDKELRRIISDISTYVETEMHRDVHTPLPPGLRQFGQVGELPTVERSRRRSRAGPVEYDDSGSELATGTSEGGMDEGSRNDSDGAETSIAPSRTKTPRGPPISPQGDRRRSSARAASPRRPSIVPRQRHLTSAPREGFLGERQARSPPGSTPSSRSASHSRPHSPMPPGSGHRRSGSQSPAFPASSPDLVDSIEVSDSAFIVLLQEIITIATEVLDTPITKLTKEPGACAEYISRVQRVGDAWSDNPELPCRGWYVQLLLAVAGLSRVVEWWEAEKGFWSFEEGVDDSGEPILFVAKPTAEDSPDSRTRGISIGSQPSPPIIAQKGVQPAWSPLGIDLGESAMATSPGAVHAREPSATAAEVDARSRVGDLHQAVDTIRAQTLLMELSLNGQLFQYLSSAWQDLVG